VRRGVDTNVLIYAHMPALPDHAAVRRFLQAQLDDPDVTLVVTAGVLHELVHVITDPRRFEPPVPMAEALALARRYLGAANVECAAVDEEAVRIALDLLERHRLGRRRVADALLAGALMSAGVTELATCDAGGFAPFEGLTTIDPRVG
jgi:toxin-antitoxin system PIN domain toxin